MTFTVPDFSAEVAASGIGGALLGEEPQGCRRAWDDVMADFDREGFKPGDVVSDLWISHATLVQRIEDLPQDTPPEETKRADTKWWHTCSSLVDQVRTRRRLHLTRAKGGGGYMVLDHGEVTRHEMRLLADRFVRHTERASDHLGDVQTEKLTTAQKDELRDAKARLAFIARTTLPRLRKSIGSGSPG